MARVHVPSDERALLEAARRAFNSNLPPTEPPTQAELEFLLALRRFVTVRIP